MRIIEWLESPDRQIAITYSQVLCFQISVEEILEGGIVYLVEKLPSDAPHNGSDLQQILEVSRHIVLFL